MHPIINQFESTIILHVFLALHTGKFQRMIEIALACLSLNPCIVLNSTSEKLEYKLLNYQALFSDELKLER